MVINWDEYDRLKGFGYTDKKVAHLLGVSPSSLCRMKYSRGIQYKTWEVIKALENDNSLVFKSHTGEISILVSNGSILFLRGGCYKMQVEGIALNQTWLLEGN